MVPRAATESAARVELPGGHLAYIVRRSPRARHLRVSIDPQRGVVVTVPTRASRSPTTERAIERFLRDREPWLRRHLARQAAARIAAGSGPFESGRVILYRGEAHRLRIVPGRDTVRRSIVSREGAEAGDELVVRVSALDRRTIPDVLRDWFRERARTIIEQEIGRHAAALGVVPGALTIRDQRTRWGSASRSGRLSFSWRLVLAPPEALETVVVHELAHLRVFGHGLAFWALVASRRPDHRTWRAWLRLHATELHATLDTA